MIQPDVSVVIVSRDRPEALSRCLLGVGQVRYPNFEVVVVCDAGGVAMLDTHPMRDLIKRAQCDDANISRARNIGIGMSSGEVIAFVDDDAVPEPGWLQALVQPLADHACAGGPVRGRNGVSWQWQARTVNFLGETFDHDPAKAVPEGMALKTEGTNMAVRRDALIALGGFDEAFRFFLDETDLNVRLKKAGFSSGFASHAEVHHGFLPSAFRRPDRVPKDLFDIGASWAVFLRKHADVSERAARLAAVRASEADRLDRHLVQGGLEPRDVRRLMARLEAGIEDGMSRPPGQAGVFTAPPAFQPLAPKPGSSVVLACRPSTATRTRAEARDRVKNGDIVTMINLSPTALYHTVSFTSDGVWEQTGGLYGKSDRTQPLFRLWNRSDRVASETRRVAKVRKISF